MLYESAKKYQAIVESNFLKCHLLVCWLILTDNKK